MTVSLCIAAGCWGKVSGANVLNVVATYAGGLTANASVNLIVVDTAVAVPSCLALTFVVLRSPNLPSNGTSTQVTVGFAAGTPTKVELSREGLPVFATWSTDSFLDRKSVV